MKKLTNVSPFILLLVPVFVMMLLTFTTSINSNAEGSSIAVEKSQKDSNRLVKVNVDYRR